MNSFEADNIIAVRLSRACSNALTRGVLISACLLIIPIHSSSQLGNLRKTWAIHAITVTARKDDAAAAVQEAMANLAGLRSISSGGGLIHTSSG